MSIKNPIANTLAQRGFTLIEIMVAVVVLAIGLLGLAGLQATSLRFNSSAYLRSQATNLAYDIADRMRVNAVAARGGAYDGVALQNTPPACAVVVLAGTVANQDIQAWRNALTCTLPLGTGSICRGPQEDGTCSDTGTVFRIIVQWDDSRGQQPVQQFTMMTDI